MKLQKVRAMRLFACRAKLAAMRREWWLGGRAMSGGLQKIRALANCIVCASGFARADGQCCWGRLEGRRLTVQRP